MILTNLLDSLSLRLRIDYPFPSSALSDSLQDWRAYKENGRILGKFHKSVLVPGVGAFQLLPFGNSPYEFILVNPEIADIRFFNPDKWGTQTAINTGQIYIVFRSNWLFYNSLKIWDFLNSVVGWATSSEFPQNYQALVSRADLCCDIAGFAPGLQDLPDFISRTRKSRVFFSNPLERAKEILQNFTHSPTSPHRERSDLGGGVPNRETWGQQNTVSGSNRLSIGISEYTELRQIIEAADRSSADSLVLGGSQELETVYFGNLTSPLCCRIYDKNKSLDVQGKEFLREHWLASGWDGSSPVFRVEFSLSGDFLHHLQIDELVDFREFSRLWDSIPAIWQYLTGSWLRHLDSSYKGKNRSRAPISPWWASVSSAFPSSSSSLSRPQLRRKIDIDALSAQIRGCLLSYAARTTANLGKFSLPYLQAKFQKLIQEWADSPDFLEGLGFRLSSLGLENFNQYFDVSPQNQQFLLSDSVFSALARRSHLQIFGSS